jgi:hypothetical protein
LTSWDNLVTCESLSPVIGFSRVKMGPARFGYVFGNLKIGFGMNAFY